MQAQIKVKNGHRNVNLNRRKAIHERCLNCASWFPKEAADCIFNQCSLHPYRLGKGNQNALKRQKAILEYCRCCSNGQVGEVTKCPSSNCPSTHLP